MGYTIWPDGVTGKVVEAVYKERRRQDDLRRKLASLTPNGLTDAEKLGVLAEEFGEVAQLVCRHKIPHGMTQQSPEYRAKLKEELIQVAAVCVAWAETL